MLKEILKNWRTTLAGVVGILSVIFIGVYSKDWTLAVALVPVCLGLIAGRDIKKTLLLVAVIFLLVGCSTPQETIIKEKIITVPPVVVHDTVKAYQKDTVIQAVKVVNHDTIAFIKYLPGKKIFDYKFKTDTIRVKFPDTIKVFGKDRIVDKYSFTEKIGFATICLGVGCVIGMIIFYKGI